MDDPSRMRLLVDEHYGFVERTLRKAGVPPSELDDEVQRTFITLARRIADVRLGAERSFYFRGPDDKLNLKAPNLFPFNGPSWSLFLEIVINLAYGYAARMLSSGVLAIILSFLATRRRPVGYTTTRESQVDPASGSRVDRTDVEPR
jgi:hypothetical protein